MYILVNLYDFHIFKLNDLKVIHNLYSQRLTQTLSKTTCNREPERYRCIYIINSPHSHCNFVISP
jgi:hypothetical protein